MRDNEDRSHPSGSRHRAIVLASVVAALLFGNFWLYEARDLMSRRDVPIDFHAYYLAGDAFDRGLNPYLDNSAAHPDLAPAMGWNPGYSSFLYPPTLLPFYQLIARLDVSTAALWWNGLSLLLLAVAAAAAALDRGGAAGVYLALAAFLLALLSRPLIVHVQRGQIDLALASLAVLALIAYRHDYKWTAATLLAIGALAKIAPAVLLISFVLPRRDWRFAVQFAASSATLLVASLLVVPIGLYGFYITDVMPWLSAGETSFQSQTLIRYATAAGPLAVYSITFGGLLGIAWWASRAVAVPDSEGSVSAATWSLFLANILVMLVVSAIAWYTAYVWTLIPLAAVLTGRIGRSWRRADVALAAAAVLLHARIEQHIPIMNAANLIGAVIALAALAWISLTERDDPADVRV